MLMRLPACLAVMAFVVCAVPAMAEETKPAAPAADAPAAVPGPKRTVLQKFDVPGTQYETTVMKVEFEPNFEVARHTHPGNEASYILDGEITLMLEGQEPKVMKAGDTTLFPAGLAHGGKTGPKGVVFLNTYVLEKGKPFLTKVEAAAPAAK